jgi:hypothetical protein
MGTKEFRIMRKTCTAMGGGGMGEWAPVGVFVASRGDDGSVLVPGEVPEPAEPVRVVWPVDVEYRRLVWASILWGLASFGAVTIAWLGEGVPSWLPLVFCGGVLFVASFGGARQRVEERGQSSGPVVTMFGVLVAIPVVILVLTVVIRVTAALLPVYVGAVGNLTVAMGGGASSAQPGPSPFVSLVPILEVVGVGMLVLRGVAWLWQASGGGVSLSRFERTRLIVSVVGGVAWLGLTVVRVFTGPSLPVPGAGVLAVVVAVGSAVLLFRGSRLPGGPLGAVMTPLTWAGRGKRGAVGVAGGAPV